MKFGRRFYCLRKNMFHQISLIGFMILFLLALTLSLGCNITESGIFCSDCRRIDHEPPLPEPDDPDYKFTGVVIRQAVEPGFISIKGYLVDADENPVINVLISAMNQTNGEEAQAVSNSSGFFFIEMPGFINDSITLAAGEKTLIQSDDPSITIIKDPEPEISEGMCLVESTYNSYDENIPNIHEHNEYFYTGSGKILKILSYVDDIFCCMGEFQYDQSDNLMTTRSYKNENGVQFLDGEDKYDSQGKMIQETSYNHAGEITYSRIDEYDSFGNLIRIKIFDKDINAEWWYKAEFEYDISGNLIKGIDYYPDGTISSWTVYQYNEANQIVSTHRYFGNGELVYTEIYEYDTLGNLIKYRDSENWVEWEYDEDNKLVKVIYYGVTGFLEGWLEIHYNQENDIILYAHYHSSGELYDWVELEHWDNHNLKREYSFEGDGVLRGYVEHNIQGEEVAYEYYDSAGILKEYGQNSYNSSGNLVLDIRFRSDSTILKKDEYQYGTCQ